MNRPPVGFIVEGHTEYNCYPSLFYRTVEKKGFNVPLVNAGGCGNIVKRLHEQLTDLFLTQKPLSVIITVDLLDIIEQGLAQSCCELIELLNRQATEWMKVAEKDKRVHPLPERITCVVQIIKFETWLMSDLEGLKDAKYINCCVENMENVDLVKNPNKWLQSNLISKENVKNPSVAKRLISASDPKKMKKHSRSFEKFYRECLFDYKKWETTVADACF